MKLAWRDVQEALPGIPYFISFIFLVIVLAKQGNKHQKEVLVPNSESPFRKSTPCSMVYSLEAEAAS